MRILHSLDAFNAGGIAELVLRFGKNSKHTHSAWGYRGSLSPAMDEVGIITYEGGPSTDDKYDVLVEHTVGGWKGDDVFRWAKDRNMATVELMHSIHSSPTDPSLCDLHISVNRLAENLCLNFPHHTTINSYFETDQFRWWEHGNKIGKLCRLANEKRPHVFAELAKQFPEENFSLAGDGNMFAALNTNKSTNLEMIGWVTDLPNFYNKLKLFVHPTADESWCYSVAYAQAAGVPIICQDIPALRESTGGYAWFADSLTDFNNQIKRFLTNQEAYDLTHAARSWVVGKCNNIYEWDKTLEDVWKRVIVSI